MNMRTNVVEIEDRIDEIQWLLRELKANSRDASQATIQTIISDIGYQASEIEQIAQGLVRSLR